MIRRILLGTLLAAALFSSNAFAAQNVANTSQKGSLLMFPLIDVRTGDAATTIIDISNDQNLAVHLECYYVNQRKGRVDFDFVITPKGSVSWDVLTHNGNVAPPPWPTNGTFPGGDANAGELVCFAVDAAGAAQVRFNHLTGVATVVTTRDADANQPKQAFKYNAWAFSARSALATPPPDNSPVGTPGNLLLTGGGDGTYDACPGYLIANFSPGGASLGPVSYLDNDLSVMGCNQDLRQDYKIHLTKLQFLIWNEHETSFSGSYQCADSVKTFGLDPGDQPTSGGTVNAANFAFSTLRTANARFQVAGVKSTQCVGSEAAGLLGVLNSSIGINSATGEDAEIGNTLHTAGAAPGYVLWDPQSSTTPERPH